MGHTTAEHRIGANRREAGMRIRFGLKTLLELVLGIALTLAVTSLTCITLPGTGPAG
jgi:hypothetical protein